MRSPGLGQRNWGQISGGMSQISAAITQPRALQMYQLLDNMEVEESLAIQQEAEALSEEHSGLLSDLYKTMQDALLLKLLINGITLTSTPRLLTHHPRPRPHPHPPARRWQDALPSPAPPTLTPTPTPDPKPWDPDPRP